MKKGRKELVSVKDQDARVILIGGALGAAVGAMAAFLWLQRKTKGQAAEFNLGEGVKIGALVVALLRNIANL